jgi:hypothetical protein
MRGGNDLVAVKKYAQGKSTFVATFASFIFPAGGQLYNEDFKKAGALWLVYAALLVIALSGIGAPVLFLSFPVWGFAIFDAYGVARRDRPVW